MRQAKILFAIFFILVLTPFVFAQDELENVNDRPGRSRELREQRSADRQASREARRSQKLTAKCERISSNIDKKIDKFTRMKERRLARYEAIKEKLDKLVDRLKNKKGVDTSALETAIAGLDPLFQSHLQKFDDLLAKLDDVKNMDCSDLEDNLRSHVQAARAELQALKDSRKQVGQYFRNNIKGALNTLREQARLQQNQDEQEDEEVE